MTDDRQNSTPLTDLPSLRQQLASKKGKTYWRSLTELAHSEAFEELVRQEFPRQGNLLDTLNRRDFLKVLGASLAMAGLASCAPPPAGTIMPYVRPPEEVVPAQSLYFASTHVLDGYARGVLVETTMGRPIKVDGNPRHPASLGGSDVFMQASLLELYDPERAQQVLNQNTAKTWDDFSAALGGIRGGWGQGERLAFLTGPVTSPTLQSQLQALSEQYPQARWYTYAPLERANFSAAAEQAFGAVYEPVYNFSQADVIVSLDSDFLLTEPGHLRYSREFAQRHQPISANGVMNRLYVIESSLSLTGSNADHRLAVEPAQVAGFANALAARLGVSGAASPGSDVPGQAWVDAIAQDLQRAGSRALVIAGERQPAAVQALALAMNQALGAVGGTVSFIEPLTFTPLTAETSLARLVADMNGGQIDSLVMLECSNPVYSAPVDLKFGEALQKMQLSIYHGLYADETAAAATWFVPAAHYLEMWGDARAFDGTTSLIQPVIEPLYNGKSVYELAAALQGQANAKGYDLVRAFWQTQQFGAGSFDFSWRDALSNGLVGGTAAQPAAGIGAVNAAALGAPAAAAAGFSIVFEADPTIWDGRFANNAWLQETPKPLTKITWDNAAQISPATAQALGAASGDLLQISSGANSLEAAALIVPGMPANVVSLTLGYGRQTGGAVLGGLGFNANTLRESGRTGFITGAEVRKTAGTYPLAATNDHWSMENRHLVQHATLEEYQAHPDFAHEEFIPDANLLGEWDYPNAAWGMVINLNTCIGCNACVVSCQAENNIPSVGKDQVARGREMHWLRIDRYYTGTAEAPAEIVYAPVPCMHCEKAPCEPVCPVEATSHSAEGINEMTYNRCVGTRYCANNCPYKVRRFNFYKYNDESVLSLRPMRNPDVTVRSRGVMEKCTYCVQRVNLARIQAEVEGRQVRDGEVTTACQDACPTRAITFGNINDQDSQVRKLKDLPLNYGMLAELGTQPRTTYLAKVTNPNPMIAGEG